jgi:Lysyl oxidase
MRRPILLMATMATALLLGSAVALLSNTSQTIAATSLYPDLKTKEPFGLRFDTATINGTTHKVLRFSNTVWNAGEGTMELRAKTVRTSSGKKSRVTQRIYDDAGGYTTKNVGDMIFHAAHNHFHFENFATYELWTRADYDSWLASGRAQGQAIKRGTKTTFCLMDTDHLQPTLTGSPPHPYYYQCSKTLQGISVGWGDTYGSHLAGQWIDLGTGSYLSDGCYVLRSVVDPSERLYESATKSEPSRESQQANEGVTFFKVEGGAITVGANVECP